MGIIDEARLYEQMIGIYIGCHPENRQALVMLELETTDIPVRHSLKWIEHYTEVEWKA